MKRSELSADDQKLLATDFGDLEKVAAAELEEFNDLYTFGMEKAAAAADEADEEDKEEKKKELDEEHKKEASARGIIIAQGMIEKLAALGEERHGDENHYFYPAISEKLAAAGAEAGKVKAFLDAVKAKASKAKEVAKEYHAGANKGVAAGVKGVNEHGAKLTAKERLKSFAIGAGKYAPHAAVAGGAAMGTKKLLDGKKE